MIIPIIIAVVVLIILFVILASLYTIVPADYADVVLNDKAVEIFLDGKRAKREEEQQKKQLEEQKKMQKQEEQNTQEEEDDIDLNKAVTFDDWRALLRDRTERI